MATVIMRPGSIDTTKACRTLARLTPGAVLLAAVIVMDPGRARLALAVGSVLLIGRAAGLLSRPTPPPTACQGCSDLTDGLVELEVALLEQRAWTMDRAEDIAGRVERITRMVAELTDHVR